MSGYVAEVGNEWVQLAAERLDRTAIAVEAFEGGAVTIKGVESRWAGDSWTHLLCVGERWDSRTVAPGWLGAVFAIRVRGAATVFVGVAEEVA